MSRDNQFLGFGRAVVKRMLAQREGGYIDFDEWDHEDVEEYALVVARSAYDLAYFHIESTYEHRGTFAGEIHQSIQLLKDLPELSEEIIDAE